MTIDKQKLQKLLWSEVASWKADCGEWKLNAESLGEFLGEKTVEEVALELLAENERLGSDNQTWRLSIEAERRVHKATVQGLQDELDRLKGPLFAEDLLSLRKDADRYRWLRKQNWAISEMAVATYPKESIKLGYDCPFGDRLDSDIDAAMGQGEQS